MNVQEQEAQLRNLDAEKKMAQDAIKLAEALERLRKNPDFKTVIETGYFKDFSHNLTMQRGMPEIRNQPQVIEANLRKLDAIGELNHFFRSIASMGLQAKSSLDEANKLETQIAAEEAGE